MPTVTSCAKNLYQKIILRHGLLLEKFDGVLIKACKILIELASLYISGNFQGAFRFLGSNFLILASNFLGFCNRAMRNFYRHGHGHGHCHWQ